MITVTVTYAQSLDGSLAARHLAARSGQPLALSGPESLAYTHQLRAAHSAILIGVNTVISDNPQLTVRHAVGPNPQPVILDSQLRCPPTARLLSHPTHKLWILCTENADREHARSLENAGAIITYLPANENGRVDLPAALHWLESQGCRSLMVEGGAQVITAFLAQRLAHKLIVTVAPRLVGGLASITAPLNVPLQNITYRPLGADLIVEAELENPNV